MTEPTHPGAWRARLEDEVRGLRDASIKRILVVADTASTMDIARRECTGDPGLAVVTLKQVGGRGRLGRRWVDERGEGLAMTLCVTRQPPERLAIAAGLAVARAVESLGVRDAKLRWPNDVMVGRRKLAGMLIETEGSIALVGVGINVHQFVWPPELAGIATSLHQLDARANRLDVARAVIRNVNDTFDWSDEKLTREFGERDMLIGTTQTFENAGRRITGVVAQIDPLRGLVVDDGECRHELPALTTSLIHEHSTL